MGVIVGLDGSPSSLAALRLGREEAVRQGVDLVVVHVVPTADEEVRRDGERLLGHLAGDAHTLLLTGSPGEMLSNQSSGADVIVVGGGFDGQPLDGSTVSVVLRSAACPVIVCDSRDLADRMSWTVRFPPALLPSCDEPVQP